MQEYSRALGMFVKVLPAPAKAEPALDDPAAAGPSLLFAVPRMSWYPNNLLGQQLRMDVSLFDDVRDRRPLEERECFYQLLAAVGAAKPRQLERAARQQLAERRDFYERMARNRHQRPEDRAAAQRALERAQADADDVVPLFNDPAAQRGKLFVLSGEALRAVPVRVDDSDIVARFGIDHYYEVEIVTPDSQNNPIVCCLAELPPNMPQGDAIHENVRVIGFFLKSYAYKSRQSQADAAGHDRQQLAPLLVAHTLEVIEPAAQTPRNTMLTVVVAVAILLGAAAIWYAQWGDRRAGRAVPSESPLPARLALDDEELSDRGGA
jgi:hypothetical protein